jgi:hypothetical protein
MLTEFQTLIAQLEYAVQRANGRTNITEFDVRLLQDCYKELKRYDDMAAKAYKSHVS